MKKKLTIYSLIVLVSLISTASCDVTKDDPECHSAVGDLFMSGLTAPGRILTGDLTFIACIIKNIGRSVGSCTDGVDTPQAEGEYEIGYSPTYSDKFSDYEVFRSGDFDIDPLKKDSTQTDYIDLTADKSGWYAILVNLNTGATAIKESNYDNNSMAIAIQAN